jgi:hypothetical protein
MLLGFLAAVVVLLLDPLPLILTVLLGFWWPRAPGVFALMALAASVRFTIEAILRGERAGEAPELYVLVLAASAIAAALGVCLGAGLYHLLTWLQRRGG